MLEWAPAAYLLRAKLSMLRKPPLILIEITQGQHEHLLTQMTKLSLRDIKGVAHICTAVQCWWEVGFEPKLCVTKTHASEY